MKNCYFIILLFIICLIFFLPFLIKPDLLTIRDNDLGRTYIPLFNFFRESIFSYQQLPLWRPDQMMGEPFVGNPLSSMFYPANLLFLIFPVKFASVVYLFIHFLLAGVFTFFLARSFKFSQNPSFAAAIFYSFSTKMLLHLSAGHITMVAAFSLFPLAVLSIRKGWIIVGSISLAFMYMTYPTIFYYALIFIIIYLIYIFSNSWRQTRTFDVWKILKQLWFWSLLAFFTFGLSAIALFPQIEFGRLSTRSSMQLEDVAIPLWSIKRFLASILFPYLDFKNIDHEAFLYLGMVPSVLFLIGFWRLSKFKKIFLLIVGIFTLLFVIGTSTPIFKIAYDLLPLLKYSRVTTRIWFAVALVVSLIAAYGLEKIGKKTIIYLALSIFLAESYFIGYKKILSTPNLQFTNEVLYQYIGNDKDLFRVYCTTYCFNPQLISKYHIRVLHGETPIQNARFVKFLSQAGNYEYQKFAVIFPPYQTWQTENPPVPDSYLLGLANVKYVASTYPIGNQDYIYLEKFEDIYLYQNKKFKPAIYFESDDSGVQITEYSPNVIAVKFLKDTTARNLIFSEIFYPGWFAFADHQKYNISLNKPIFRKLTIPAGSESLKLKYQPETYSLGKTITYATIAFLILWNFHKRRRYG